MKLIWTNEALEKLLEIRKFISQDSPERGEKFINYLVDRGESIFKNPQIGRNVPEISNPNIRELIAKKYRIVYYIQSDQIEILTIFEGHRLLRIDEISID